MAPLVSASPLSAPLPSASEEKARAGCGDVACTRDSSALPCVESKNCRVRAHCRNMHPDTSPAALSRLTCCAWLSSIASFATKTPTFS